MKPLIDPRTGNQIDPAVASTEMLEAALECRPGSNEWRSFVETALKLEKRPRGRPQGTDDPYLDDGYAVVIMLVIAVRTGLRAGGTLARLAVDTGLVTKEKATYHSTIKRLSARW